MLISSTTRILDTRLGGEDKAIELLANAGFDAFDFGFLSTKDSQYWLNREDWRDEVLRLKAVADSMEIICNQSHACAPSSIGDTNEDNVIFQKIVRCMEAASILGAEIIIVHPKQHLCYAENAKKLRSASIDFYKNLIPYAEKFGIKIATENMWQKNPVTGGKVDSVCSRAFEMCDFIDTVASEWFVGCLDIGHTRLVGADTAEFIRTLGRDRLKALHIHDNDSIHDSHTLPYTRDIDFKPITDALYDIGYDGDITFEAQGFFNKIPLSALPASARLMYDIGRDFALKVQGG